MDNWEVNPSSVCLQKKKYLEYFLFLKITKIEDLRVLAT